MTSQHVKGATVTLLKIVDVFLLKNIPILDLIVLYGMMSLVMYLIVFSQVDQKEDYAQVPYQYRTKKKYFGISIKLLVVDQLMVQKYST